MSVSYFDATVPLFIKNLTNLKQIVEIGDSHRIAIGMSEVDFLGQKLTDDMFPLVKQVQIATDNAKGATARLAQVEPLSIADTEATVSELLNRIDTVIAYLKEFTPEQFIESGDVRVTLPYFPDSYFLGGEYVWDYALPNFFFHVAMTYALIRAMGAPLGKKDYIGGMRKYPLQ